MSVALSETPKTGFLASRPKYDGSADESVSVGCRVITPFTSTGLSYPFQLDDSIFKFRGVGWFIVNLLENTFSKQ